MAKKIWQHIMLKYLKNHLHEDLMWAFHVLTKSKATKTQDQTTFFVIKLTISAIFK